MNIPEVVSGIAREISRQFAEDYYGASDDEVLESIANAVAALAGTSTHVPAELVELLVADAEAGEIEKLLGRLDIFFETAEVYAGDMPVARYEEVMGVGGDS